MAFDSLKDSYYALEDKIGRTGAILLAIVIVAALAGILWLLLQPPVETKTVQLNVFDSSGRALENATVKYTINEITLEKKTNVDGQVSFEAPIGSTVGIEIPAQTIEGKNFEAKTETFSVEDAVFKDITLQEKGQPATERQIIFQNPSGARITEKLITIRLSCVNGFPISPGTATDTDKDGVIKIMQPSGCDIITAIVTGPAEFKEKTLLLDSEPKTAVLEPKTIDSQKATIRVKVRDSEANLVTGTSFTVTLRNPDGSKAEEKTTGYFGEAFFANILAGTYNITVLDPLNEYGVANVSGATVSKGETKDITVTVSRNIKRTIRVTVLDKMSNARVKNAKVQLFDSEGIILGEGDTGADANTVVFPIIENSGFSVFVLHEEYLYERKDIGTTDENITIRLEKITPENSGKVLVKVVDESFKPVEGAKVALRNFEDDFLASDYKTTDFNGTALFKGMKIAKYYAYATKEPVASANNKEDAREIDLRETTGFIVQLIVGNATLTLSAMDIDENPIAEAEAEIFGFEGKSLGKVPLPNGTADYTIKADKKIFVVFRHADFATVQTLPEQLWPDKEFEFKATMPSKAISGGLRIEHEGIYNEADEKTTMFEAGKRYLAVFKIIVPENVELAKAGLHFRVGDEKRLENEALAAIEALVGNPSSITKGTTFNAPAGYQTDSQNLTEGDAKWINIEIANAESGVYFFGVMFRVKKTTLPSALLTMHYRAYGTDSSGKYARDPLDEELGNSENTQLKQALYAKTIDNLRFYEGEAPDCEEEFCYSGEWLFDNRERLYLEAPYEATVSADYNFHFSVTNNSEKAFENSELFIQNYTGEESSEEIKFTDYIIEDSSGKKIRLFKTSLDKIEKINLGRFLKGTSISGNIKLETKKVAPAKIYLYIIADGRKVFQKIVELKIMSNKKMLITVEPDIIPALVENRLKVKVVQEKETGNLELAGAFVAIKKTSPDKTETIFTGRTNSMGITEFTIPASSAGTILKFTAEKPGYFAEPLEKKIVSELLAFDPASISAELDTRNVTELFFDEKITNLTGIGLELASIQPAGKLKRVLDISAMLNYSSNFIGKKISALDTTEFEKLLLVKLNSEAAKELAQNTSLDGNFWITVKEPGSGSIFDFKIPLKVGITIADLPQEACIIISKSEWVASTQGNRATLEFEAQNSCNADMQALALENLMAAIEWSSSQMGSVEISLTDSETGETNTETLGAGWSKLFANSRPGASYFGFLTFTPKEGFLGKDAQFAVKIDGQMLTSSGLKFVGSNPKAINATIKIINLEQCLQFKDAEDIVTIAAGAQDAKFSIDSSNCGATEISISLCREDSGKCAGNAEGGIQLSKTEFTLTPEKPSQEITAFRESIPGIYGITVEAKVPGKNWQKVRIIDLLVEPNADSIFTMDKYSFIIKGIGSKDSATLSNKNVVETVTVDASACDWGTCAEKVQESRDSGMGAMMPLMAMPLMMGALNPLLSGMGNAAKNIAKAKELPTTDTASKAITQARDDAKAAADKINGLKTDIGKWGADNGAITAANAKLKELDGLINGPDGKTSPLDAANQSIINNINSAITATNNSITAEKPKTPQNTTLISQLTKKLNDLTDCKSSFESLVKQRINALKADSKKAKDKMDSCTNSRSDFALAKKSADNALKSANAAAGADGMQGAQTGLNNSIQAEKPDHGVNNIGSAPQSGSIIQQQSIPKIEDAKKSLQEAGKQLSDKSTPGLEQNLEEFKKCLGDVKIIVDRINYEITDANPANGLLAFLNKPELIATCPGIDTSSLKTKLTNISTKAKALSETSLSKNLFTPIDNLIKEKLNPLLESIGTTGPASASPENVSGKFLFAATTSTYLENIQSARDSLSAASTAKSNLSNAMMPAQTVANNANNPQNAAMQQAMMQMAMQAAMMAAMGSMMGGGNSAGDDSNPANDRIQQPVTAWVINLQKNAKPITMDKAGIDAYWDKESFKLIGQYEKQEIGVVFENTGISKEEPVYSTATFKSSQTRHTPTVRFPDVGGIGQISAPMLQLSASGFNGPGVVPGTTSIVTQKFHLKFITMDYIAPLPPIISEKSCLQGTMIGSTGAEALPKIKLNWDWADSGISSNACIEGKEGIFCDATQFSIMLSKRLKALQEFVEKNDTMPCPKNPGVEIIKEITKNYNKYLIELGLEPLPENMDAVIECWIPKSTIDIGPVSGTGNKTALEYYVENNSDIVWTAEVQSIDDLKKLLKFKAYLMKDNYNNDFKRDFAEHYKNMAFLNAPEWFVSSPEGKWADYFYSEELLNFTRKNLDSSELLAPGLYEVSLNIDFADEWKFFGTEAKPRAKIISVFNYLQEPYPNSVFYYMPVNSNVGRETSNGREGYGVSYANESDAFNFTGSGQNLVSTSVIPGSAGNTTVNVAISRDLKLLNSIVSNRGMLLKISQEKENSLDLAFSPNYATPVSMKMHSEIVPEKFSAFYEMREAGTPKQSGSHLAFWTAMGQCHDFTGVPLSDRFDFAADRQASASDPVNNWQFAYAIDWEKAEKSGDVFLRTVFYTPANSSYTLNAIQPNALAFRTPDSDFQANVDLGGASTMVHNNRKAGNAAAGMRELFDMVQSEDACITNSGAEALFWWNPNVLYEAQGSAGSQKALNDSVACISG